MAGGEEGSGGSGKASGSSFGAMGFKMGGDIFKGYGEAEGQKFLAERDRRNAEYGKIRADQLDTQRREELDTVFGNIDAIRAASNIDYLSPTTAAIKERQQEVADRQRIIERTNILNQAREDELSAQYRDKAAKRSVLGGFISAASRLPF